MHKRLFEDDLAKYSASRYRFGGSGIAKWCHLRLGAYSNSTFLTSSAYPLLNQTVCKLTAWAETSPFTGRLRLRSLIFTCYNPPAVISIQLRRLCSEVLLHVLTRGGTAFENWPLRTYCHHDRPAASGTVFAPAGLPPSLLQPTSFLLNYDILFWNWLAQKHLHGFVVMQQLPRSVHPQGNGNGAAHRSGVAPASVPPLTPQKKGEYLDNLIRSLEDQYQLGLKAGAGLRSPARSKTAEDTAIQMIQRLYYTHGPALDDALAAFAAVATFIPKDQRLEALSTILRNKIKHKSPMSRSGTPMNARNVPPKSLKTPQPCKCASETYCHT